MMRKAGVVLLGSAVQVAVPLASELKSTPVARVEFLFQPAMVSFPPGKAANQYGTPEARNGLEVEGRSKIIDWKSRGISFTVHCSNTPALLGAPRESASSLTTTELLLPAPLR